MKIYIAGPITGTDDYIERFIAANTAIIRKGHEAVNPVFINRVIPTVGETAISYGHIMNICKALLGACDAIYMMPGWQRSNGARVEHAEAFNRGLKFYTSIDAIPETAAAKAEHNRNRQEEETA